MTFFKTVGAVPPPQANVDGSTFKIHTHIFIIL